MLDRILYERLQEHVRHAGVERLRIDTQSYVQTIAHQCLLNLDVLFEKIDFLLQRHFLRLFAVERETQQFAERDDAAVRGLRITVDQFGNSVQGVEEKMWMQLHPESL